MEITQLRQFQSVARGNSITAAAKELHVSQPALSIAIKKLEHELGASLFDRRGNAIELNETGRLALMHADLILAQEKRMRDEVARRVHEDRRIRLGFSDPGPLWYCAPRLCVLDRPLEFARYDPSSAAHERSLLSGGSFDLIVTDREISGQGMACIPLADDRLLLSVRYDHPLAKEAAVSARDRRIGRLLLFKVHGAFDARQKPFWDELEGELPIEETDDYFLFSQMIEDPSIATVTTEIVRHYRADGADRTTIPLSDDELSIRYFLSYPAHRAHELQPVIEALKACFGRAARSAESPEPDDADAATAQTAPEDARRRDGGAHRGRDAERR